MNAIPRSFVLSSLAAALMAAFGAQAQDKPAPAPAPKPAPSAAAPDPSVTGDTVIVTGTSTYRAGFDTPLSAVAVGAKELARLSASSQADILATLPGIKAEGGGGEVATNIQVRGLPSSGQYQFTPLEYDGLPALSTFGLNSSAYDVYIRNDLGVQRLEFVSGGVSNLFGPGSVAGIINYISKTGGKEHKGILQTEVAEQGRVRNDIFLGGPMGDSTYYALSGFYRYDAGPLKSGFPSEGLQLRGNIKHEFADGGTLKLFGQVIDDSVQFFLPLPLDGKTLERVTGTDGRTVYTTNTSQAAGLTSVLPGGQRYTSPISNGVLTRGASLGMTLDRDLGNDFGLNVKAKYARYKHQFNLFVDGDGIINVPETQSQYLTNRSIAGTPSYTYVDSGQPLAAGTLLYANRLLNRDRPVSDFSSEANLTKRIESGGLTHNLTLGTWMARATADDNSLTQTFLAEFVNQPRLVNLSADGVSYTRNGLVDPSVGYTQNRHSATRFATYLADQIEGDRWAFDVGVRIEHMKGDIRRETTSTVNGVGQGGSNEAAALTSAVYGTGRFLTGTVDRTETAASAGALYKLGKGLNLYGNLSHGFFFPELRSVAFDPQGRPQSYKGEIIDQAEVGAKVASGDFSGSAALFYSRLSNRRSVTFQNIGGGGIAEVVTLLTSRAPGVEAAGTYRLSKTLSLNGNLTYTDHQITEGPFKGKELERKPKVFANADLVYDDGSFDASVSWNYQGRAYTSVANNIELPAYQLWRLTAGYRMAMGAGRSLRLGASVFNVFDSQGLAEGSPRQGTNQQAGGQYFDGRPILPRRIALMATYSY